jgi:hypothetical protein
MPSSHNTALKKRESRFDCIVVNVAMRVLAAVFDRSVLFLLNSIKGVRVDLRVVGHNYFDAPAQVVFDGFRVQ